MIYFHFGSDYKFNLHFNRWSLSSRDRWRWSNVSGCDQNVISLRSLSNNLSLSPLLLLLLLPHFPFPFSVGSLKSQIHKATTIPQNEIHLVLPGGQTPIDSDLALNCLQLWNVGTVYFFTTVIDPSFKMIHSTNSAVSRLSESHTIWLHHHFCSMEYMYFFPRLLSCYLFFLSSSCVWRWGDSLGGKWLYWSYDCHVIVWLVICTG